MRHNPAAGAIIIMLRSLKMHGMAQAVGELTEQGSPAFETALPILSQLLKAETADREVRSTAYQLKAARFPELKGKISGIIAVRPEGDKVSRMAVVSAKFEAGQVFLPERAPWLADFEAELFAFPGSKNDDQCNSVSQALFDENVRFPMTFTDELIARLSEPPPGTRFYSFNDRPGYPW